MGAQQACSWLNDWKGGSLRPGAIFLTENRDREIAIHLTIKFYNLLRLGITVARDSLEELTKHGELSRVSKTGPSQHCQIPPRAGQGIVRTIPNLSFVGSGRIALFASAIFCQSPELP